MSFRPSSFLLLSLLAGCAAPVSVDGEAARAAASLSAPATITFSSDWSARVDGELRAGATATIVYDASRLPTCRGEEGGRPQWSIGAASRIDGGAVRTTPIAGLMAPSGGVATIELPRSGELEIWFENTNKYGCVAYDSDFGRNYRFRVGAAPGAPAWMGSVAVAISRATCELGDACDGDRRPADAGFRFETWARQRALVAGVYFDVWQPGVTDRENPDLWKQLDVRVYTRVAGTTDWTWSYVDFQRRVGNDARYRVPLRRIDPLGGSTRTTKAECPAGQLRETADGFYVELDLEYYFTVNGAPLRPADADAWRGTFADYKGLYTPCL
jgi:hypothetical protein